MPEAFWGHHQFSIRLKSLLIVISILKHYLTKEKDDEEKIYDMETHMTNVLDMIDNGTTDQPPIVKKAVGKWRRFGKRPSEDNDVPLQRKASKILKNVSVRDYKFSDFKF